MRFVSGLKLEKAIRFAEPSKRCYPDRYPMLRRWYPGGTRLARRLPRRLLEQAQEAAAQPMEWDSHQVETISRD